jgi:ADP-dependent NAD(P)H-hydrate dehydratase / NAD(P)H-hydrate epimerase
MKIFNTQGIREIDEYTILNQPISSVDLMENAAMACADWITTHYGRHLKFAVFAGQGNNGGDGLAVARLLNSVGFLVDAYVLKFSGRFSVDAQCNLQRLIEQGKVSIIEISDLSSLSGSLNCDVIIDALFGTGLSRPLAGLASDLVKWINHSGKDIISIDIPSGLFSEDNPDSSRESIVKARHTLTFQFPKLAYLFAGNGGYVGEWHVLPIGLHEGFIKSKQTPWYYIEKVDVSAFFKIRSKFSHKGTYGHALLISGSYGKMGAAVLSSRACLRTGIGLFTVHVPQQGNQIVQTAVPEAMLSIDDDHELFSMLPDISKYTAIGIGPGIGTFPKVSGAFYSLLEKVKTPMVIDADAINLLGGHKEWLKMIPAGSVITPHPKEFERIAGPTANEYERLKVQVAFSGKYNIFVVLKGAYTAIACPDGNCYFNSTGNPGMATAGSGDVLTGIILSLLAQGYTSKEAAIAGVYLHGLAGDFAATALGEESMIAGDIVEHLGDAFKATRLQ